MLVRTPAMKLAVEIRGIGAKDGKVELTGVTGAMPCSVEMAPAEVLAIARGALKPAVLRLMLRALLRKN